MTLLALTAADYLAMGGKPATQEEAELFIGVLVAIAVVAIVISVVEINKKDKTNSLETGGTK